jgi:hypothetical protein
VVGRVGGVLREDHIPEGSTDLRQYTVFVLAVETYLKGGDERAIPIIKVNHGGGALPWHDSGSNRNGVGFEAWNAPLLRLGDRYILFLERPPMPPGVPTIGRPDEYKTTEWWEAKLLLRNGYTHAPAATGGPQVWRFAGGPDRPNIPDRIVEIPERDAIAYIRKAVAEGAGR